MRKTDHPNIVKFHGMYESHRHVYLVMELVTGGQLLERIIEKVGFSTSYCPEARILHHTLHKL